MRKKKKMKKKREKLNKFDGDVLLFKRFFVVVVTFFQRCFRGSNRWDVKWIWRR